MEAFTTFKIAEALGEKYQRLRGWLDSGAIAPSIRSADGVGVKAQFSRLDVHCIGLFKELLSLGFSRHEAGVWANGVRGALHADPGVHDDPIEHIMIVKYGDSFLTERENDPESRPKWYKSFASLLTDLQKNPQRGILLNQEMFGSIPLKDLFTHKGRHKNDGGATDYSSMVIVNFGKIVRDIDAKLG